MKWTRVDPIKDRKLLSDEKRIAGGLKLARALAEKGLPPQEGLPIYR